LSAEFSATDFVVLKSDAIARSAKVTERVLTTEVMPFVNASVNIAYSFSGKNITHRY
jgi:hypothetical protein